MKPPGFQLFSRRKVMGAVVAIAMAIMLRHSTSVHFPEEGMNASEIIRYYGYPVDEYTAITDDGYHLLLHRIPHGISDISKNQSTPRPIIFLQHGLTGSSACWIFNEPSNSAGFVFADAGFDVWMGNSRGNSYSTHHTTLTRDNDQYWKFTFDHLAKYDLEAMINKALTVSGQTSLNYFGHSEGGTTMLAKLAAEPEFASKIKRFFALTPVTTLQNARGSLPFLYYMFKPLVRKYAEWRSDLLVFPRVNKFVCTLPMMSPICDFCVFQSVGGYSKEMNHTRMQVYLSHVPAGSSTLNQLHWSQLFTTDRLTMFDTDSEEENLIRYGTPKPPVYDFGRIRAPVYLYWSDTDWLTDEADMKGGIIDQIRPEFLVENNKLDNLNHFDVVWGAQVPKFVYEPIIRTMRNGG